MAGKQSDDLWWMFLFVLSRITYFAWIVISVGVTVGLAAAMYNATEREWVGIIVAIWCFVLSWVGAGFVEFSWNKVLIEDAKHTSAGETK